ncbi:MAG TPA: VOC family protein [Devosiaceae bacterium]|jgi:catechol 2,3-dioxygenase-like lactoylglutathione lyase family enzyme
MTASVDHIGLNVTDYDKAKAFYAAALKPLGMTVMMDFGVTIGLGEVHPFLWISAGNPGHVHLAIAASTRAQVDAFYAAAIAAGGKDNGKPGLRTEYSENYYAAFIIDADGHNIEAVCHAPA